MWKKYENIYAMKTYKIYESLNSNIIKNITKQQNNQKR